MISDCIHTKRCGVSDYHSAYEEQFARNLRRYAAIRQRIKRRVDRVLSDPYANTERLGDVSGKLNLRGCRSARVDRNVRIIFVFCEECRRVLECEYCFAKRMVKIYPTRRWSF